MKREIHTNAAVGDSRFICSDQSEGQLKNITPDYANALQ